MTFPCSECGEPVHESTDDNYNSDHTRIQCPYCKTWYSCYEVDRWHKYRDGHPPQKEGS
jgi:DNA-directed RNA polymerase subunit RPC12/RpoP